MKELQFVASSDLSNVHKFGENDAGKGQNMNTLACVIRLRRIYNFLLFHANILQLPYTFGNFLYYFLGLTY